MGQPNWKSELLTENCIVAVPGSNVFKDQWFQFFKGKDLVIISDNDNAGEQMTKRVVEKLMSSNQQPKGISGMVWDGIECNDIRDMVTL
jgi:DNA primase